MINYIEQMIKMTKNNVQFGLAGEKYVAQKLDSMGIKYWWKPSQKRNYFGADLITEHGVVDVKTARPRIKTRMNKTTRLWGFNCHHHGKKQTKIDFFILIVVGYKNKEILCFVMPKEICNNFSFIISERQIKNKKYNYFLDAWDIITDLKKFSRSNIINASEQKCLITFTIPKKLKENILRTAHIKGISASAFVRNSIRFGLKSLSKDC